MDKNSKNADETEFQALLNNIAPLDAGIEDDIRASALDFIDSPEFENEIEWISQDQEIDEISSDLTTELFRREKILKNAYPFEIVGSSLKLKENKINLFYLFCLIISQTNLKPQSGEKSKSILTKNFERISMKIISASLGEYSDCHHFGWPRDNNSNIEEAMIELKTKLPVSFEWEKYTLPFNRESESHQKDLGIDQFIWVKCPTDRKIGNLFILGQCACGENYTQKFNDISIDKISGYFHPMSLVTPVRAMSIPFCLSDDSLGQASKSAGWFFDRLSLSNIYFNKTKLRKEYDDVLLDSIDQTINIGSKLSEILNKN